MRAILCCGAALVMVMSSLGCERSPTGQSDLAENARQVTSGNTKSSAVVGGNNAPADDAGSGVTAAQIEEAGVMLDASCTPSGTRNCGETR